MSLQMLIACKVARVPARNAIKCRCQSSSTYSRSGRMLRVLGAVAVGAGVGSGVLVYANYDAVFKNKVDDKVPRFSEVVDKAADLWVNASDNFSTRPGIPVKDNSQLVFEYSRKKGVKGPDTNSLSEVTSDSGKTSPSTSPSRSSPKHVAATTSADDGVESTPLPSTQDDGPEPLPENLTPGTPAGREDVGADDQACSEIKVAKEAKKSGDVLEEAYEKFLVDSQRVKDAQQQLMVAWEDLYTVSTAPATEVEGVEQQIADVTAAASVASCQLKATSTEYDTSCKSLEELVLSAPNEGFATRASIISSEMKLKAAEVNLGLVLVKEEMANAKVAEAYQSAVQESRHQLQKELIEATSSIDPKEKDALIMTLSKKLDILQRKLRDAETEHARRLMLSLEVQRRSLEQLGEDKWERSLEEREAKYKHQLNIEANAVSDKYHGMLREQLRLQHESLIRQRKMCLRQLSQHLSTLCQTEKERLLSNQKTHYQFELARAQARLKGVEGMVDTVASSGEKTIQLQMVHNSCDTLVETLQRLNSDQDETGRFILGVELESIRRVAHEDPFIVAILNSVPAQAVHGMGIQSEAGLRVRFGKVRRVCRNMALVPSEGAGPLVYLLSYVQSLLTFRVGLPEISTEAELEKFDTYDILQLADGRMRNGDLEGVVDCLAYLKGEPKRVATDWLEDARAYLETRQAIQLIQTYVTANTHRADCKFL